MSAMTASQISSANSSSVPWKLSGEYSKTISVSVCPASSLQSAVARTARSTIPAWSSRKTTRRCVGRRRVVEVHDRAAGALDRLVGPLDQLGPRLREHRDRRVGRERDPRRSACGRTRSRSSRPRGTRPRSPSRPSWTSRSNIRCLRAESIGLTSAWFPSRRSVEHQIGAWSTTRSGHVRSGRSTVGIRAVLPVGHRHGFGSSSGRTSPGGAGTRNGYVAWSPPLGGRSRASARRPVVAAAELFEALPSHCFQKHSDRRPVWQRCRVAIPSVA